MMYEYKVFNGFVKLNRYLHFDKASVEIPSEINGKPVTRIGDECFYNHSEIKEIQFPTSLERIGNSAFEKCSGIEKLILPSSVVHVGVNAFRECTGLKKVVLSPNLKVLNQGVFSYCQLLRVEFIIPYGLQEIRENAFYFSGRFELVLPESVKKIGMGAFCYGPHVSTNLKEYDGWFSLWPYRETIKIFGVSEYGKVINYSLLSEKCGVLFVSVNDEVRHLFFPSIDNDYQFFYPRSQDLMKEYLIDGEVKSYYEAWKNGSIEYKPFYQEDDLERENDIYKGGFGTYLRKKAAEKKKDTTPNSMYSVYEKYREESPEKVLVEMQLFILSLAESFRNGEITEDDFFLKTYVRIDLLNKVLELKDETSINHYYNSTVSDMNHFIAAYNTWKATGKITYERWMVRTINTKGNLIEATKWVFQVIDALLFPINKFSCIDSNLYKIPVLYFYIGNAVYLMIDDYLVFDSVSKFDELFSIGKSYRLKYLSGIEVDITISSFENNDYVCTGIIYGYMTTKQKMIICENEGRVRILFNKRTFSKNQITYGTIFHPIPHPDWNQYNLADLEWSYQREAEYKSLRLPYMLGMITRDQILSQLTENKKTTPTENKHIIDISEILNKSKE